MDEAETKLVPNRDYIKLITTGHHEFSSRYESNLFGRQCKTAIHRD